MIRSTNMRQEIPFYVTRETAGGQVAHYSAPIWMTLFAFVFVCLNAIAWGIFGLVACVWVSLSVVF